MSQKQDIIAGVFGQETDVLKQYEPKFEELDAAGIDVFDYFIEEKMAGKVSDGHITNVTVTFRQWKEHMAETGRHPAVPKVEHVVAFAEDQRAAGNKESTVKSKLSQLKRVYNFFIVEPEFPMGFGEKDDDADGEDHHPIELDELGSFIEENVKRSIRDRAIIVTSIKLGLRASELCNIRLSEVNIAYKGAAEFYPEMATHPEVEDRPDSVFIPADREMNKSENPRVIPIDGELKVILVNYLMARPQVDEPWLFLSKKDAKQMDRRNINDVWRKYFLPEYAETDTYKNTTSHFGRHFFTNWWSLEKEWPIEKVQYLRGDVISGEDEKKAIHAYINPRYETIEADFRDQMFDLGLSI